MKNLLFSLLLANSTFAYQVGDAVDTTTASKLGLNSDKTYVIDFFASWCGSCKKEIPLISIANSKIDNDKTQIIGVDVDKNIQDGINFQNKLKEKNRLNFKVINDPKGEIISKFSPIGMPTLYYVKNNKVLKIITGAVDDIDNAILNDLKAMQ
jgi:cytochrome c biogenesis protein CcmG/thiol:disulfide interchange protein DsbE